MFIHEYYSRVLAYIAYDVNITARTYAQYFNYGILWVVPYVLLYPCLTYHLNQRFHQCGPCKVTRVLLAVDVVYCGLDTVLLGFSVMPDLMLLLVLGLIMLIISDLRLLDTVPLVSVSSALLIVVLVIPPLSDNTPVEMAAVSILFCGPYICITAFFDRQQDLRLAQVRQETAREQKKVTRLARSLAKCLSPQVWEMISSGREGVRLETQRRELTVFFSDTRSFTKLSEELKVEALTDLLSSYLDETSKITLKHGGTIDKFVSGCVVVFSGDPSTQGTKKDTMAAVSMSTTMHKYIKMLRQQWRIQSITKPLGICMGTSTGYYTVSNLGADTRMGCTVIGREVNPTGRLENASEAGKILISHETYSLIKDMTMCRDKGRIVVRGFGRPAQICQMVDSCRGLGVAPGYVERELSDFSMYLGTSSIQNYDKERVIQALQQTARRLRDEIIL